MARMNGSISLSSLMKAAAYSPSAAPSELTNKAASASDRRRAVMLSPGRPQPAYPLAPCHLAPCSGGDRPGRLLCGFQERAEIFEFGDQSILDGDHAVSAFALALEVRPVTTRALFGPTKLGSATLALSVTTTSVTDR